MAAGENNCTSFQFRDMLSADAVDYAQPSVTKVGGVTEFLKVATLADAAGVTLMPHSPYFGPGFLATLQLTAARGQPGALVERYHMDLEASLYGELIDPVNGAFAVPDGPGPRPRSRSRCDQDLRFIILRALKVFFGAGVRSVRGSGPTEWDPPLCILSEAKDLASRSGGAHDLRGRALGRATSDHGSGKGADRAVDQHRAAAGEAARDRGAELGRRLRTRSEAMPKLSASFTKSGLCRSEAMVRLLKACCWMRLTLP